MSRWTNTLCQGMANAVQKNSRINGWDNEINANRLKPTMFFFCLKYTTTNRYKFNVIVREILSHIHSSGHSGIFNTNWLCVRYYSSHYFYLSCVNYSIRNRFWINEYLTYNNICGLYISLSILLCITHFIAIVSLCHKWKKIACKI